MKKHNLFLAIICIITLFGCQKKVAETTFLNVIKVDIVRSLAMENSRCIFHIHTSSNITSIIPKTEKVTVLREALNEGYNYTIQIDYPLATSCYTTTKLLINGEETLINYGRFALVDLVGEIPANFQWEKQSDFNWQSSLILHNPLSSLIKLVAFTMPHKCYSHTLSLMAIPTSKLLIHPDNLQTYHNIAITVNEAYGQIENYVLLEYLWETKTVICPIYYYWQADSIQ